MEGQEGVSQAWKASEKQQMRFKMFPGVCQEGQSSKQASKHAGTKKYSRLFLRTTCLVAIVEPFELGTAVAGRRLFTDRAP